MRKIPDCPKCKDERLSLKRMGDQFRLSCPECGWTSGTVTLATGQDLDTEIAAAATKNAKEAGDATNN